MTRTASTPTTPMPTSTSARRPVDAFVDRHIGTDDDDLSRMLATVGFASAHELVATAVPESIRADDTTDRALPAAATEAEALAELREIAAQNTVATSMIGLGYYGTITPAVIRRNVLENPSWYTAYTPYQPEISQGRLEALINFQTMVADLTGLTTANASMLDEATAAVEGMLLARRVAKRRPPVFVVDADALPQTKQVLATRAASLEVELVELDLSASPTLPEAFGVFIQYPGASGHLWDPSAVIAAAHEQGAQAVVAADLLGLTLAAAPGDMGADIAVGTSQRFGVPMSFGGPHAGYLAVRAGLERQLPGRLVGVSYDADGAVAYRLTLQTREQHIRRQKATSNICTAQVLLAVMAAMYAVYHGPERLRALARRVHEQTLRIADAAVQEGASLLHGEFFDTITLRVADAAATVSHARDRGLLLRHVDATTLSIAVDEVTAERTDVVDTLREAIRAGLGEATVVGAVAAGIPSTLERTSGFLTHPVFSRHHSETALMRYLKRLADKDYALDRGMIPLGSCTMKLNAAAEMEAITWPEFADIHPFAPFDDVRGYHRLIGDLERWLADVTGYDAVSMQPNAGSQGELTGLLAIARYHQSRGDADRTVCLIPSSAHGTNAASAVLVGMKVVVVACDEAGNVDLDDLRAKIDQHGEHLAALMITYPSTHGVYETQIRQLCDAVHDAGGQVYIDGANLNALLGFARFGEFGGDVSHLNLHKTFCIPHGGGGPGVGPVAAKSHLAPFLPACVSTADSQSSDAASDAPRVAAAPYGSPGILPITWAYIRMMGAQGLKDATAAAVVAANYIAARLDEHYPVLYTGEGELVAHECILDLRPLTAETGITIDDVVKRLIDYGFHAPTMSFPVAGTLMVEPTESEDLAEIDRFVEAMIAIRHEAEAVAAGTWPGDDNPLVNAPHTASALLSDKWEHPYTRREAAYPAPGGEQNKYWPPVRRVDQAWGDRNLFCSCPPVADFAEG